MRSVSILLMVALYSLPCLGTSSEQAGETGFLNRTVEWEGVSYRYQVYVPVDFSAEKKWPVILYLHGAGSGGEDGLKQTEEGLGPSIRLHSDRYPCLAVFPQSRGELYWSGRMISQALKALQQTLSEFNGDSGRVYLIGASMGGYGTWHTAALHRGKFAAIVPICGGVVMPEGWMDTSIMSPEQAALVSAPDPYGEVAKRIGNTPVWAFHGEADQVIPVTESRKAVAALKAAGGDVRYTEYPGVDHEWQMMYDDSELLPWLLKQSLKE